jgi:hypothetical protein
MTTLFLALVPLVMITGALAWLMTMGARDQARSDAWAADWQKSRQKANLQAGAGD